MWTQHLSPDEACSLQMAAEAKSGMPLVTVLSSSHGPIVKRFRLVDGAVEIKPAAQIHRGHAQTVAVDGPGSLLRLIDSLAPNQALSLGRLEQVGARRPLASQHLRRNGEIARTKEFFVWNNGPACMLLDVDTKSLPETVLNRVAGRDLADVIVDTVPEIETAPMLVKASSSAGIRLPDGKARAASGLHCYVFVADGRQIPEMLCLIHDRLWAAGLGFFTVSRSGGLLERSLVDTTVGSSERLIFAADPIVHPPLTRDPPRPRIFSEGLPLAYVAPPDFELVERMKADAREAIKPAAKVQKKHHETEQIDRVADKFRVPRAEARRIVKQRLEMQILNDDDLLETGRGHFERVADFLDRVTRQTALPCPIEGSDYGLSTAYYYPASDRCPVPRIVSFAHGNITEFHFARFRRLRGLTWIDR